MSWAAHLRSEGREGKGLTRRRDNNKLSYLTGLPASVQVLHVPDNRLTSLSSFGHLVGLRELDLSGNKLERLTRTSSLWHATRC